MKLEASSTSASSNASLYQSSIANLPHSILDSLTNSHQYMSNNDNANRNLDYYQYPSQPSGAHSELITGKSDTNQPSLIDIIRTNSDLNDHHILNPHHHHHHHHQASSNHDEVSFC